MTRRAADLEYSVYRGVREEVREYTNLLFPKAVIDLQIRHLETGLGIAARVTMGRPAPHDPSEIADCLGQLGVSYVSFAERQTAAEQGMMQQ